MIFLMIIIRIKGRQGVLFNDLASHYSSGAELVAMQVRYIGMFQAG